MSSLSNVNTVEDYFMDTIDTVVLQPTTLCNLNCKYCYLPQRNKKLHMTPEIPLKIASYIEEQERTIEVLWHGGEPLAAGKVRFKNLLAPFKKHVVEKRVQHAIQTNASLIDEEWCEIITEHSINIGVSIDGTESANQLRVDWSGNPAFHRIQKGISLLKQNQIPFGVIVVINTCNISDTDGLYEFLVENEYLSVGINIEEYEGANTERNPLESNDILLFWERLFQIWRSNPIVRIREFDNSLRFINSVLKKSSLDERLADPFPTVAWNGNVSLLSPELAGAVSSKYKNFVVGNVLEEDFANILRRGLKSKYVQEYLDGLNKCREECTFYDFCRGGHASNKFYETGSLNTTITRYCQNSKMNLIDAIIKCV